jgi:DNA-directed RNA polymerase specialized sigma24 family protein
MTTTKAKQEGSAFTDDPAEFWRLVNPLLEEFKDAARRELNYLIAIGDVTPDSVTPEELVDEVLAVAWEHRQQKPAGVELEAWLLALMYQRLARLAAAKSEEQTVEKLHLPDEEIEEIIPDPGPTPEEIVLVLEKEPLLLDQSSRRVLLMHDLYGISVRQISAITGKSPRQIAVDLIRARRTIGPRKSPEFRIGDRVRVKATGEIDYIADSHPLPGAASEAVSHRYVLTQDMGRREEYCADELQLIERGDAWALAENPDPHHDHGS